MEEYKIKCKKGIDDLKSIYAFHGNSQGDDSVSNKLEDYINSKGWMSFGFDCELTQEAIDKESKERAIWNENYINELQKSGEYLKEYEISLKFNHNSDFDNINKNIKYYPFENYGFVFLNEDGTWSDIVSNK